MEISIKAEKFWLCNQAIDFRCGINRLTELVSSVLDSNPNDGVYVFLNRRRDRLKLLGWHGNGFVLLCKRLEKGHFKFAMDCEEVCPLEQEQLSWLLAGLDWQAMRDWKTLSYKDFC